MIRSSCGLALIALALFGCDKGENKGAPPPTSASAASSATRPASAPVDAAAPGSLTPLTTWGKDLGFKTPESIVHDETADIYFVSNIDGKPLDADGKGFIAKVAPEAVGVDLKFIVGGAKGVTLNAPKGLALTGDTLWVADIDTVRTFDRKTGAPKDNITVPGATFLNDIAPMSDGTSVVVTDTGMKSGKDGSLEPSKTDAVYKIDKDKKLTTIAKSADLGHPNGVVVAGDKIWVVTFGSNELYTFDDKGARTQITKLPKGQLDGIVMFGSDFFISSWEGKAVYRGQPGGTFVPVIENVPSPADILFDTKRNRIIVPVFQEDELRAYALH